MTRWDEHRGESRDPGGSPGMRRQERSDARSMQQNGLLAAEVALGALTLAAVASMARLFAPGAWFWPLVANAVLAHVVLALLRRFGLSLGVAAVAAVIGAPLAIAWTVYPSTTLVGIPTGETFDLASSDLGDAWNAFQVVVAPAAVLPGFVVATAVAVWFVAFVADWAAFRLWVPMEATLPAATLFVFTSLLGTTRGRGWSTALFAATALAFLLLQRVTRQETTSHWVAGRAPLGRRSLVVAGACLASIAVAVGVAVGPSLPGADAEPLVNPRGITQDERRVTVSPLVDIKARLVDQPDLVVFRVQATQRAYWRLTSLDEFDGRAWTSSGSYGAEDGELPEGVRSNADSEEIVQRYAIEALSAIWLPAAFEPRRLDIEDARARYDEESATLIVDQTRESSDSVVYEVASASPRFSREALAAAPAEIPDDVARRYLELPEGFSERIRAEAERIVAGASTPYDRALALQNHLRTFAYDLQVANGHDLQTMEQFLFEVQRGYCEQFAGTFAAMARSIGLPARVAVGFTPGEIDPADPDQPGIDDFAGYIVRAEFAHAWPEVYIEGAGWVLFEPTPGRGAPFSEGYTGVPERQAAPGNPGATSVPVTTAAPGTGDETPTTAPGGELDVRNPDANIPEAGGELGGGDERSWLGGLVFWLAWLVLVPLIVGALLYGAALLVLHRRRRARVVAGPVGSVEHAWGTSVDSLAVLGFDAAPHETHAEVADRARREVPGVARPIGDLALLAETAVWAGRPPTEDDVARAEDAGAAVTTLVRERTTVLERTLHTLRSETVMRQSDGRRHVDAGQTHF